MIVLGLSGGFGAVPWSDSGTFHTMTNRISGTFRHDSAAAIVRDGEILAAVEEERLTRLKHTNRFALSSIEACLDEARLNASDIDFVAYYFGEEESDTDLGLRYLDNPGVERRWSRDLLNERLSEALGPSFHAGKLRFVRHHTSHATSALCHSGFDEALVVVMDGQGDSDSISLLSAVDGELTEIRRISEWQSLGHLYQRAISFIGFGPFDEYKAMGLAPHGNRERFAKQFRDLYELHPDGSYAFDYTRLWPHLLRAGIDLHPTGGEFTQDQKDFAAGLQGMLEDIALHIVGQAQRQTGHANLCVSGGVGLNCSLNGRFLTTGLFRRAFFDPAAHDAGSAIGAAFHVSRAEAPEDFSPRCLTHVYFGPSPGPRTALDELREAWSPLVTSHRSCDVFEETASLIAGGAIVGWVRGRSEFGPRALGNRSILADPRPRENVDRINLAVKKRERFRPFAPSVMSEYVQDYFEIPECTAPLDFMIVIVNVRPDHRELLGAVTHVDGTARVQSVARDVNEPYWLLLEAFRKQTGVPVLLNTSFNNDAEPIVQTMEDAISCFLTTALDVLVIDDVVFEKRTTKIDDHLGLIPVLAPTTTVALLGTAGSPEPHPVIERGRRWRRISRPMYEMLLAADGELSLAELGMTTSDELLLNEVRELWASRFVLMSPLRAYTFGPTPLWARPTVPDVSAGS